MKRLIHTISPALVKLPPLILFSHAFQKELKFLAKSQYWSKSELEEYQLSMLRRLLKHAYENVPYYRRLFRSLKLRPEQIDDFDSLKQIPPLDKDTFKRNTILFLAKNISPWYLERVRTSGTTGKPLEFYLNRDGLMRGWAYIIHQWNRVGYTLYSLRVEIRGPPIIDQRKYEYSPLTRVIRLSPVIETREQAEYYIKLIKKVGAEFIHGYPSAITSLSKIIEENGIDTRGCRIKAILFTSEIVYDWQREIVERVFNARTFAHYGQAEHVATASECECSTMYHFMPQYGIVEIDPRTKEIIATGFLNWATPLIRYKTTDVAEGNILWSSKCRCGRNYYPLVEQIGGRLGDVIVTPKGTWIPPTIITNAIKGLRTINATQVIQEDEYSIIINIEPVPGIKVSRIELKRIRDYMEKLLGNDMKIEFNIVPEIKRSSTGKFKWIISKVARKP